MTNYSKVMDYVLHNFFLVKQSSNMCILYNNACQSSWQLIIKHGTSFSSILQNISAGGLLTSAEVWTKDTLLVHAVLFRIANIPGKLLPNRESVRLLLPKFMWGGCSECLTLSHYLVGLDIVFFFPLGIIASFM